MADQSTSTAEGDSLLACRAAIHAANAAVGVLRAHVVNDVLERRAVSPHDAVEAAGGPSRRNTIAAELPSEGHLIVIDLHRPLTRMPQGSHGERGQVEIQNLTVMCAPPGTPATRVVAENEPAVLVEPLFADALAEDASAPAPAIPHDPLQSSPEPHHRGRSRRDHRLALHEGAAGFGRQDKAVAVEAPDRADGPRESVRRPSHLLPARDTVDGSIMKKANRPTVRDSNPPSLYLPGRSYQASPCRPTLGLVR